MKMFEISIVNIVISMCSYLVAYYRNLREYDECFQYEYESLPASIFKYLYLYKSKDGKIRKITKEQELAAILQFIIIQFAIFVFLLLSEFVFIYEKIFFIVLFFIIWISSISQTIFFNFVSKKTAAIAERVKLQSGKYNDSDSKKHLQKILRHCYKMKNDGKYQLKTRQINRFFHQYVFWDLYDDHDFIQTVAQSKKFRYSNLIEWEQYDFHGGYTDDKSI